MTDEYIEKVKAEATQALDLLKEIAKSSHRTISMSVIKKMENSFNNGEKLLELVEHYFQLRVWGDAYADMKVVEELMQDKIEFGKSQTQMWGNWSKTLDYIKQPLKTLAYHLLAQQKEDEQKDTNK